MHEEESKLKSLNDSLYSRTRYHDPADTRSTVDPLDTPDVEEDFASEGLDSMLMHERRHIEGHPVMKKLFISAFVFFIIALGITAFIYLGGGNLVSSKNVDISVLGPVSVSAGAPIELGVTISNKNNVDLSSVNLFIQYPEGTKSADNSIDPITRTKEALGSINSGASITRTERAVLFGQKGDVKTIKISVDYQIKGSNATFTKEKLYDTSIGSIPVTMNIVRPAAITSGDKFTTNLVITANSSEVLKNVLVRGEYPYGFTVLSSNPLAVSANNIWALGDLAPGDKKTILISGVLSGENEEERTFRFYTGVGDAASGKFDAVLSYASETINISRSSLGLVVRISGDDSETTVAPGGRSILGSVLYQNNLPSTVRDGRIRVKFSGSSFDKSSVSVQNGGFYNSSDNSITWDRNNQPALSVLGPGANGTLSFSFSSLAALPAGSKNNEISLNTTFNATPQSGDASANLLSSSLRTVKIASVVSLSAKSLFSRGPFTNSGPIPPKAEKTTTYTIVLDLGNTQNDILNPSVVMTLGPNVKWVGQTSPSSEEVKFDEASNKVTWSLSTLASGAGFSAPGKEVSFQLGLTPSIGQVGSAPVLASGISFSGTDSFTDQPVNVTAPTVTTRIDKDPKYVQGDELVVK